MLIIGRRSVLRFASTSHRAIGLSNRMLSERASAVLHLLFGDALGANTQTSQPASVAGIYTSKGWEEGRGENVVPSVCPATGEVLAHVREASVQQARDAVQSSADAYRSWRLTPAPVRGQIVRQIREALSAKVNELGALISLEQGKPLSEGIGEVQEAIDICDYAVGLSRTIQGRILPSERPNHVISEHCNPLGTVAILSASNFPCAVHSWSLAISLICGNANIWKGSPLTNLVSIATTRIIGSVLEANNLPGSLAALTCGGTDVGKAIVNDPAVDLVVFTGSEHVGRQVGMDVQSRFGKSVLELGGNAAAIVMPDADMKIALPAVLFASVGTAGQRCTSTRRLYLHRDIADTFLESLKKAYASVKIGDPLVKSNLCGPVHTKAVVENYHAAIQDIKEQGGQVLTGGESLDIGDTACANGNWVKPTIALHKNPSAAIFKKETFAPILNVAVFDKIEEAIEWNNAVPQGLSSSLFTRDMRDIGLWTGAAGSDCGIVNVNVSTSGAEIGAAFGGNKSTGWGRESGGDAWKQYVRWSASTVNYGNSMPLAQGVTFDV